MVRRLSPEEPASLWWDTPYSSKIDYGYKMLTFIGSFSKSKEIDLENIDSI